MGCNNCPPMSSGGSGGGGVGGGGGGENITDMQGGSLNLGTGGICFKCATFWLIILFLGLLLLTTNRRG